MLANALTAEVWTSKVVAKQSNSFQVLEISYELQNCFLTETNM